MRACGRAGVRACGHAGVPACRRAGLRECGRACTCVYVSKIIMSDSLNTVMLYFSVGYGGISPVNVFGDTDAVKRLCNGLASMAQLRKLM